MNATMGRRKFLMGGAAIVSAGLLQGVPATPFTPSIRFMNSALADIPRPDYMIRVSSNENPYGPSRVALQAIADSLRDVNKYAGITNEMRALMAGLEDVPVNLLPLDPGQERYCGLAD